MNPLKWKPKTWKLQLKLRYSKKQRRLLFFLFASLMFIFGTTLAILFWPEPVSIIRMTRKESPLIIFCENDGIKNVTVVQFGGYAGSKVDDRSYLISTHGKGGMYDFESAYYMIGEKVTSACDLKLVSAIIDYGDWDKGEQEFFEITFEGMGITGIHRGVPFEEVGKILDPYRNK